MGVAKSLPYKNTSIILHYWRINFVGVDIETNTTTCRVGGYISKTDALEGKAAIESLQYTFRGSDNPINMLTDPREYQNLIHAKLIEESRIFMPANALANGTIVSDLPE